MKRIQNGIFLNDRRTLTDADDLLAINLEYLYAEPEIKRVRTKKIGSGTKLVEPVFVEEDVEIGANCQIGPGVYIEKNVSIGDDVLLENSVVLRKTTIPADTVLHNNIIYR